MYRSGCSKQDRFGGRFTQFHSSGLFAVEGTDLALGETMVITFDDGSVRVDSVRRRLAVVEPAHAVYTDRYPLPRQTLDSESNSHSTCRASAKSLFTHNFFLTFITTDLGVGLIYSSGA